MSRSLRNVAVACLMLVWPLPGPAEGKASLPCWPREVVRLADTIPIQDGGRVKPLRTFATFKLLKLSGRRTCRDLSGERLNATAWLLDCLFRPEAAMQYKCFRVGNDEVLEAAGVAHTKRSDRYAYVDLVGARPKLMDLARTYSAAPANTRTRVRQQLLRLAENVIEFEELLHYLDFARGRFPVADGGVLGNLFPDQAEVRFSDLLSRAPEAAEAYRALKRAGEDAPEGELDALTRALINLHEAASRASALALFPPEPGSDQWMSVESLTEAAFRGVDIDVQLRLLAELERLTEGAGDVDSFEDGLRAFHGTAQDLAQSRGHYATISLEATYYRLRLFHWSWILFIIAFLLTACSWLRPQSRLLGRIALGAVALPGLLLACGIVMRCVIRGRPPVTTLYETILFTTLVAVAVALFMELVGRRRVASSMGAVIGVLGLFVAGRYEIKDGVDTMPTMVAVLDTNLWLTAHVTTIIIGYASVLLSCALGHVYVVGRLFRPRPSADGFYPDLARMIYGVVCFGLLFSVLGTVLGGIWANESWGRFWGWDPKENGALMICLWLLTILHGRLGGYLRDLGVAMAAVFGGIILGFSWFGVNLLGVGLHTYGFTTGVHKALTAFYTVEALILLAGGVVWLRDRGRKPRIAG